MKKRILNCDDTILDEKYFILSRKNDFYFYVWIEWFFTNKLVENKIILSRSNFKDRHLTNLHDLYINKENYQVFKMMFYEEICDLLKKINLSFEMEIINDDLQVVKYNSSKYNMEDVYIVLDYIQERSVYLGLDALIEAKIIMEWEKCKY